MSDRSKRNSVEDGAFSYRASKDGKVFISWYERQVTVMKGNKACKFVSDIERMDGHRAQLAMAKATGSFKHGNERAPGKPD